MAREPGQTGGRGRGNPSRPVTGLPLSFNPLKESKGSLGCDADEKAERVGNRGLRTKKKCRTGGGVKRRRYNRSKT